MRRDARTYLYDIKTAAQAAQSFVDGFTLQEYETNLLVRSAVERQLEIVGEALNRLLKLDPSFQSRLTATRAIIGFRNRLAHDYDDISSLFVWDILEQHLPILKAEVSASMMELGEG